MASVVKAAGKVAAQLAVKNVLQAFKANSDCNTVYLRDFLDTDHQVIINVRHSTPEAASMATTVGVMLVNNKAVWGHVGDSRLYHFRALP
jgi:serine/threonine protein phosphatase PrpC